MSNRLALDHPVFRFLLPEKEVRLKVIFDNVRNTLIGVTFYLGALWAGLHAGHHGFPGSFEATNTLVSQ